MAIKDLMFDEKSEKSRMVFTKMLCYLDSPKRLKYNNPDKLLGGSGIKPGQTVVVLLYGVVPAPVISMKEISKEIHRILKPDGVCAVWTVVPFWTPYHALRHAGFKKLKKVNGVFRVQKYIKVIKD